MGGAFRTSHSYFGHMVGSAVPADALLAARRRGPTLRVLCVAVGILGSAGSWAPAAGQALRGRLLDLATNRPLDGGVVTLIPEGGDRVVSVVTDGDGTYVLRAPRPGRYFVEARRIGYRSWVDGPVDLHEGDDWETEFHLLALPVELDPLESTAEAMRMEPMLVRVGFYERQRADFGHFITRDEIEKRSPPRMSDLLNAVPGVRIMPEGGGLGRSTVSLRGSVLSEGTTCHPRVYVDGLIVIRGDARLRGLDVFGGREEDTEVQGSGTKRPEIALDDVVMPEDVEAVEVYRRGIEVPARFGGTSVSAQCGVIVIWTRRGRTPGQ